MSMDNRSAVLRYQFAERIKSELIIVSKLLNTLVDYRDEERKGAKKMLIGLIDSVRAEMMLAHNASGEKEFRRGAELLSEAISLTESDGYGPAGIKVAAAVSAATTVAQESWHYLNEHGLL
jgi:hypothetical protein